MAVNNPAPAGGGSEGPADASTLTGTTLASNVVNSSLSSVGTLAALTVTAPVVGSVIGNAGTTTALATPRAINGVDFDGTAPITITAAAGTLTGATLAVGVTASSLTSVGTLAALTVTAPIAGSVTGSAGTVTTPTFTDADFTLTDNSDVTKIVQFQLSGITTGSTRTITLPDANTTLAGLNMSSQTFSGNTLHFGSSTGTTTYSYAAGPTLSSNTKTVNIGTAGVSGSTTNINIGSSTSSGTITLAQALAGTSATFTGTGLIDREVGYRNIPQNSQSAAYTAVAADAGKHLLHPSADTTARTFTIPANSSVAYPVGTALTFINQNAGGVITIAITTDVMRLAGPGTTGSRTLAANGIATAIKVTSTEWIISGTGLT